MKGLVLCGGQSTRMGNDKGMMAYQSLSWAQYLSLLLNTFCDEVFVSINDSQHEKYVQLFPEKNLIYDNTTLTINGPLLGIMSAHLQYTNESFLVLACDMIDMNNEVLSFLLQEFNSNKRDATVFVHNLHVEPLCGIYTSGALNALYKKWMERQLTKHSMHFALEQLNTHYITMPDSFVKAFANYNTLQDFLPQ
jgi:molybdopterin-guanine dinucleotide biosynthesis protein A